MKTLAQSHFWIICAWAFLTGSYALALLPPDWGVWLTKEDGLMENLGAFFFLVAGAVFIAAYVLSRKTPDKACHLPRPRSGKLLLLLLGIIGLVAFVEEISWGQRIFGLKTPSFLVEENAQKELNIHNLWWFHGRDRSGSLKPHWQRFATPAWIFNIFWLIFCVAIPLLCRFYPAVASRCRRWRIPILPLHFAFWFLFTECTARLIRTTSSIPMRVTEVKETDFAFLYACLALYFCFLERPPAPGPAILHDQYADTP